MIERRQGASEDMEMATSKRIIILLLLGTAFANMLFAVRASHAIMQRTSNGQSFGVEILRERIESQGDRIVQLEKSHADFKILVSDRLARLETVAEVNNKLLIGIFISICLMIVGGGISIFQLRKKTE